MILEYHGKQVSEFDLRVQSLCDAGGTTPSNAVAAARLHGFHQSTVAYLTLSELRSELARGIFPIVYLDMGPDDHAVVVTEISVQRGIEMISFLDPHQIFGGPQTREIGYFVKKWEAARNTTIIVE